MELAMKSAAKVPDVLPGPHDIDAPKDPWALPDLIDHGTKWAELTRKGKLIKLLTTFIKLIILLGLLYLFVCSISVLSSAFRLVGGKRAGEIFQNSKVLLNPVAGLMIGVLATVLVQSSSTSTSIVVTMVNAGILTVAPAVFIIMGANIGTSVTNSIVAVFHAADRTEFRRAFAAATVHDMFNWLAVAVLLPLEVITQAATGKGYLVWVSESVVGASSVNGTSKGPDFLKALTKPLTNRIIQLDKKVIADIARNRDTSNRTIAKRFCDGEKCKYLFNVGLADSATGMILVVLSLVVLCVCLLGIVKTLRTMLQGPMAKAIRTVVNRDLPGPFRHLTGYLAILTGAVLTFLVQSSSIFTSTLTPLVAVGVLTLDRTYPMTLGSNIGTTGTAIIAALASDTVQSLQIAICHLAFNVSGILLWYPVPAMRKVPLSLAKTLGNTTATYRWFAILYIATMFLLLPTVVFALSLAGWYVLLIVSLPVIIIIAFVLTVNLLRERKPSAVPEVLKSWDFLPQPLRSLEPFDKQIKKAINMVKHIGYKKGPGPDLAQPPDTDKDCYITRF